MSGNFLRNLKKLLKNVILREKKFNYGIIPHLISSTCMNFLIQNFSKKKIKKRKFYLF